MIIPFIRERTPITNELDKSLRKYIFLNFEGTMLKEVCLEKEIGVPSHYIII